MTNAEQLANRAPPSPTTIPTPTPPGTAPPEPRQHLVSARTRAAMRIQQTVLTASRAYLRDEGFVELLPPVIGPVTDPGGRGSKQVDIDYYGHRYKLMTSGILYKQASLLAFDRIFSIASNVRLEPLETANTQRHLAEFHQIDVELANAGYTEAMALLQGLLKAIVDGVLTYSAAELDELGRDTAQLRLLLGEPFGRTGHPGAVASLRELGHPQSVDAEIDWAGERMLSEHAKVPFFVTDYPKGCRGFYDRESLTQPGVLRNFDLLAAEGYGELASGGEREWEYRRVITRMRETGENPAKYGWYLRMVRDGIPASAGFGLGLERLVRYLGGLEYVWQASAYPKVPGLAAP